MQDALVKIESELADVNILINNIQTNLQTLTRQPSLSLVETKCEEAKCEETKGEVPNLSHNELKFNDEPSIHLTYNELKSILSEKLIYRDSLIISADLLRKYAHIK